MHSDCHNTNITGHVQKPPNAWKASEIRNRHTMLGGGSHTQQIHSCCERPICLCATGASLTRMQAYDDILGSAVPCTTAFMMQDNCIPHETCHTRVTATRQWASSSYPSVPNGSKTVVAYYGPFQVKTRHMQVYKTLEASNGICQRSMQACQAACTAG